jgi:hypothetical protein
MGEDCNRKAAFRRRVQGKMPAFQAASCPRYPNYFLEYVFSAPVREFMTENVPSS